MLKKWIVGILVVGMVLVAGAAYADYHPTPGIELPSATYEVAVWQYDYDTGTWVLITAGDTANAKCFAKVPKQDACNKQDWTIDVDISASVTQWVEWSLTATDWEWFVRKPGKYAADCITGSLKSNYDVYIDYDGFGDLVGTGGVDNTISVFYVMSPTALPSPPPQAAFYSATELNDEDDLIVDSEDLHNGIWWKLWNYIIVEECNSACEYSDEATITLELKGVKNWIDPLTGKFDV